MYDKRDKEKSRPGLVEQLSSRKEVGMRKMNDAKWSSESIVIIQDIVVFVK